MKASYGGHGLVVGSLGSLRWLTLACFLVLGLAGQARAGLSFLAGPSYGAGINTLIGYVSSSVVMGDFNGNGKTDLAVANVTGVYILLGNGDGTFAAAVRYSAGSDPVSVAVGDFNGDGKADLAVANQNSNVSILLGNGDGTFAPAVNYSAGSNPRFVAVADFNGDGKVDLAVVNSSGVSILLGNGDGTFVAAVNLVSGSNPSSVAVGDFNGDGKPDLAVADYSSNYVSVLLGNGNGTFAPAVNYVAGSNPRFVAVGDFNGDGKADLAVANEGGYDGIGSSVSVLVGNGNGTFAPAVNYASGSGPLFVAVNDLNGDGKPDLMVANLVTTCTGYHVGTCGSYAYSGNYSILLGNGDGTFAEAVVYYPGLTSSVVAGDFNGDGKPDLVVANSPTEHNGYNVSILINTSTSSNANLSNLTLSNGNLNPVFAPSTFSYTTWVANGTSAITVTSTAADSAATIKVNGTTVASGSTSNAVMGANTILVTAQDGSNKTYTVMVNTGTLVTSYRLYSNLTREHLYTTDSNEYSVLPVCCGWLAEGAIYKLIQGAGSLSGVVAVPYYRLYNPFSHQHHWTTDANEYNVLGALGWIREGVDGYIFPTAVTGTLPLYRLYLSTYGGLHLWTTDANERNVLITTSGWADEGVAGYVVPLP